MLKFTGGYYKMVKDEDGVQEMVFENKQDFTKEELLNHIAFEGFAEWLEENPQNLSDEKFVKMVEKYLLSDECFYVEAK